MTTAQRIERRIEELDNPHRDEEVLRYLYNERGLSQGEIGDLLDVDRSTVRRWLREHDIGEKLSASEAARKRWGYDEGARIELVHAK